MFTLGGVRIHISEVYSQCKGYKWDEEIVFTLRVVLIARCRVVLLYLYLNPQRYIGKSALSVFVMFNTAVMFHSCLLRF